MNAYKFVSVFEKAPSNFYARIARSDGTVLEYGYWYTAQDAEAMGEHLAGLLSDAAKFARLGLLGELRKAWGEFYLKENGVA
jgi:hypothetical protein